LERADVLREISDPLALLAQGAELSRQIVEGAVGRPCLRRDLLLGRSECPTQLGPQIADRARDKLDLALHPLLCGLQLRA